MSAELTEEEFSKYLNTTFHAQLGAETVDLELEQVKSYPGHPEDQKGMERFSLFFRGPATPFLPQSTHALAHDEMGIVDIFLVPIQRDAESSSYEAVFNYLK